MSQILFVADVHLQQEQPAITAGFLRFLEVEGQDCQALYILGDLFEAWIGDDDPNPLHQQVAEALAALRCPIYFIHGNRDFLLGKHYAQKSHLRLLPESHLIEQFGKRLVLLHGDTLCTDDKDYLKYRAIVQRPWLQWLFRRLPLRLRLKIATKLRQDSQQANQSKSQQIMDVNPQAVAQLFQHTRADFMVHGHTHRPALHSLDLDNHCLIRAVLGAWHETGWFITWDSAGIQLKKFPL